MSYIYREREGLKERLGKILLNLAIGRQTYER